MTTAAIAGLVRLSGLPAAQIDLQLTPSADGRDSFSVELRGGRLLVRATGAGAALAGYAQFARRTGIGSVSRSGIRRPSEPLSDAGPVSASSPYEMRVAYNITVGGYTTPFFDEADWERELDILAASGITAAHVTLGQEAVWVAAFQQFGYTEEEVLRWIVAPSHQPWQWLNNIQDFGGGVSRELVARRVELGRWVLARMRELDITPILPGFSGTVPGDFAERNPGTVVVPQGKWFMDIAGPERPDWLSSETEGYARVADAFYSAQRELFGDLRWWAVDLLHEGGKTGGVALSDAARGVEAGMLRASEQYRWFTQAWAGNPKAELLDALDGTHLVVLDLIGEHWAKMDAYAGIPWVWGILPNYGGRLGLYGDLAAIAAAPTALFHGEKPTRNLVGLTDMAEGVANNPVVWDLFHDLAWTTDPIDLDAWLVEWVEARYGVSGGAAVEAWRLLQAAYGPWRAAVAKPMPPETGAAVGGMPVDAAAVPQTSELGTMLDSLGDVEALEDFEFYSGTDSVIGAIPSLGANQASTMGPRSLAYAPDALLPALDLLISSAAGGTDTESSRYDLVDVARQVLVDSARALLPRMAAAFEAKDSAQFERGAELFLQLVDALDAVLATHDDFRLDSWTESARRFGGTPEEADRLVDSAKRLVTSWGAEDAFVLTEYSTRDWAGLVGGYYRERWVRWFDELRAVLEGRPTTPIDWYAVADEWVSRDVPTNARELPLLPAARRARDASAQALAYARE